MSSAAPGQPAGPMDPQVVLFSEHPELWDDIGDLSARGLSAGVLRAMAGLAADAGLAHRIAPVRPNLKERTRPSRSGVTRAGLGDDGTPFDPWIRRRAPRQ